MKLYFQPRLNRAFNFLVLATIGLFSLSVKAGGGHIVRNGGGTAELKLIDTWDNLGNFLKPATALSPHCQGALTYPDWISMRLKVKHDCYSSLKFSPIKDGRPFRVGACHEPIEINSNFLYDRNGDPISDQSISVFAGDIFASLVAHTKEEKDWFDSVMVQLLKVKQWFFSKLKNTEHWLISFSEDERQYIEMSCNGQVVELDQLFKGKAKCLDGQVGTFSKFEVLNFQKPTQFFLIYNGRVRMSCSSGEEIVREFRIEVGDDCQSPPRINVWR